jgi:type IV pilus modification protein PilV
MMIEGFKRKNQKGFTLIELLVAIALLAVGLLAAASMQGVALNGNAIANRTSTGAALAQQVAEETLSHDPVLILGDPILVTQIGPNLPYPTLDPVAPSSNITIGANTYRATYTITPNAVINGQSMTGTTQLDVSVNYLPGGVGPGVPVGSFTTYRYTQ